MAEYTIDKIKFGNDIYKLASGSVQLPIASASTLGGIKVGSGLSINSTTGVLSATGGGTADSVAWQNVTSKPTTIAGYGITDANISNGTITLGSNTITPLTSYTESDPVFSASAAADITSSDITNWNSKTSNTGTVTSVQVQATSPVVSSTNTAQSTSLDTTISLANAYGDTKNPYGTKTANYVLAGPSSGSAATPAFRALVSSDIPDLRDLYIGTYGVTEIAANTDLNDVVDIGTHYCSAANVSTLSNCPTLQAFSMRVTATINPASTYHRQQELIDVYGFRWVRDIVTGGTAAQHWKLLNILDRIDLSYFATSEIPVYGASTEQVCVLNQNVTSSTVSSAATVMDALCKILPGNSNFRLWWTGNLYNESSYGGYRFGNIGAAMPQAYGALFIEKDYDNMALCKFIGYSPYTVWTGIWTSVNNNGWQGWIPTAQTSVSRLTFSDVFDTTVVTAYTSGTSSSNDYMTTYLDKDGRSVSGWICFKNVSATAAGGSGVTIGTLPEGWRPYRIFQVGTIPTTSDRRLLINKAGNIRLYTSASVAANTVMYFKVDFIAVS